MTESERRTGPVYDAAARVDDLTAEIAATERRIAQYDEDARRLRTIRADKLFALTEAKAALRALTEPPQDAPSEVITDGTGRVIYDGPTESRHPDEALVVEMEEFDDRVGFGRISKSILAWCPQSTAARALFDFWRAFICIAVVMAPVIWAVESSRP